MKNSRTFCFESCCTVWLDLECFCCHLCASTLNLNQFLRLKYLRFTSLSMSPHYYQRMLYMMLFSTLDLVPSVSLKGISHQQLRKHDQHIRNGDV